MFPRPLSPSDEDPRWRAAEGAAAPGRVLLRPLREADWWHISRWEQDEEILTLIGREKRLAVWPWPDLAAGRRRVLAVEWRGRLIGYVEARHIDRRTKTAEMRICIGEKDCWGQGLGTEAVRRFMVYCRDGLGLEALFLRVYRRNERAIRCYLRCGFSPRGYLPAGRRVGEEILLMVARLR